MSQQNIPNEKWSQGTEVIGLFNFQGSSREDLAFKKRDILTILQPTKDPMWYYARHKDGKEGMIPANYVEKNMPKHNGLPPNQEERKAVKLNSMPWFHGKIKREEAEALLQPIKDGLFLIRESTNYPGDYTLCVCSHLKVEHYHILCKNSKFTIDEEEYFENLNKLVEHYKKDADGLCTSLKRSVSKKGNQAYSVDSQAFIDEGWEIKKSDLIMQDAIGKGEFGDVYKASFRGKKVAVKSLKDATKAAQKFLDEASVMTSLRHPNLVQLMGIVLDERGIPLYIVTEFMGKGSLVDYLRSRGRNVITKKDQINFASDTCAGLAYLEKKNVVHRDLAARNVLISDECTAKVSDFGLAKYADAQIEGGKVPIKWTAPEALRQNKFTSKSDMWSFGILLWEIYSFGRVPYPRIPIEEVSMHVERGYRMEAPDGCPTEMYDFMRSAWELNPEKRPTFVKVSKTLDSLRASTV